MKKFKYFGVVIHPKGAENYDWKNLSKDEMTILLRKLSFPCFFLLFGLLHHFAHLSLELVLFFWFLFNLASNNLIGSVTNEIQAVEN